MDFFFLSAYSVGKERGRENGRIDIRKEINRRRSATRKKKKKRKKNEEEMMKKKSQDRTTHASNTSPPIERYGNKAP